MALTNYTELKSAIATWLNRTDLTAAIPDFITLAEKQIARKLRRTTVIESVSFAAATPTYTLPATVAELRSVRLATATPSLNEPLRVVSKPVLDEHRARFTANGRPRYAAVVGGTLHLAPVPDILYSAELTYFQKLVPLTTGAPTNIVLTEAPDAYLFGALKEAAPYLEHDERVELWEMKFNAAIAAMNEVLQREEESAMRNVRAMFADRPTVLANYGDLQSAIAGWLDRTDLASQIPSFIKLAESEIARELRRTVTRDTAFTISSASTALPAGAAEIRSLRIVSSAHYRDAPFEIVTPEMLAFRKAGMSVTGRPRIGAVIGSNLVVAPAPDQAYTAELIYYNALVPLSDAAPTNTVLTEAPDLYLYGALKHAAPYLEHDVRLPQWKALYDDALAGLHKRLEREEHGAHMRPMHLPVVFGERP